MVEVLYQLSRPHPTFAARPTRTRRALFGRHAAADGLRRIISSLAGIVRIAGANSISSFSSNDSLGRPHLHSPSLACRVFLIKKPYSSKSERFVAVSCALAVEQPCEPVSRGSRSRAGGSGVGGRAWRSGCGISLPRLPHRLGLPACGHAALPQLSGLTSHRLSHYLEPTHSQPLSLVSALGGGGRRGRAFASWIP